MKVSNPRFPHTCVIYRMTDEDSFSDGEKVILYEGECRKDRNMALRTFSTQNVVKGDYVLQIPDTQEQICAGDMIDVTDRQGTYTALVVTDIYAGNLGTSVFFNMSRN